jgi:hypothetical protein
MKTRIETMTLDEMRKLFNDLRWQLVFVTENLSKRAKRDAVRENLESVKDSLFGLNCLVEGETK